MRASTAKQMTKPMPIRLDKIVVAVDFSPAAQPALVYAASIARQSEAELKLVHVFPGDLYPVVPPPPESAWVASGLSRTDAEKELAKLVESPALAGLTVEAELMHGDPATVLSGLSRDASFDLVVVGTHGGRGLEKFLMGSVAEKTFLQAECPVLTVGPGTTGDPEARVAMRTILYATDLSPAAQVALPYALSLAQEHQSKLVLLHVDSKQVDGISYEQTMATVRVEPMLEELIPEEARLWFEPELMVRFGRVPDAILAAAREVNADLIVLGVRGAGATAGFKTHLAGSTAYKVVREAPCPVLTVRR